MSVTNKIMTPMTSECEACTRSYTYSLILHISLVFAFLVGHQAHVFLNPVLIEMLFLHQLN